MRGRATPLELAAGRRAATAPFTVFAGAFFALAVLEELDLSDFLLLLKSVTSEKKAVSKRKAPSDGPF
jgi:hypothetical protein